MLHIGIVACSTEGAALCYRTISLEGAQRLGPHEHPEVSLHSHSLAKYMNCVRGNDWAGVAELMLSSAEKLAGAGADFLICPDNTIHQAFALIEQRSPRPWLHIARVVAAEAQRQNFRRLAVLGTKYLMEGPVYREALKAVRIECCIPSNEQRERIDQIIFDELVNAELLPESLAYYVEVIRAMRDEGCDAVVLGCTEIPLLVTPGASPLPTVDSTRLLARAALRQAVEGWKNSRDG
jgi:aspartate racemase